MRKRICFILFVLLFLIFHSVKADEDDYILNLNQGDLVCPTSWSAITPIANVKRGQVLATGDVVSSVISEDFWWYHANHCWYKLDYYVKYYIETKDDDGNIRYEEYKSKTVTPYLLNCGYEKEINSKKYEKELLTWHVNSSTSKTSEDIFLILPSIDGKKVKWRYEKSDNPSYQEVDIDDISDYMIKKDGGVGRYTEELKDYVQKLRESNIQTINVTGPYDKVYINFYEEPYEEMNFSISCSNSSLNKYDCSLSLKYDYMPNSIKISMSSPNTELNDFEVKGAWLATDENESKTLEYTNLKNEYGFIDEKEIATFSIDYDGANPKEYVEKEIMIKTIELKNNTGTYYEEALTDNLLYSAQKNIFESNIVTTIKEVLNPKTGTGTYILLIWVIISLIMLAMMLNKKRVKKFVKTN